MKILIVAATTLELDPISQSLSDTEHQLDSLVTGVGMTATAFALGRQFAQHTYDLAINVGLAGAFDSALELGTVVQVKEDQFSELGAESKDGFIPLDQMGIGEEIEARRNKFQFMATADLPDGTLQEVRGITVNAVHGKEESIREIKDRLNPQVESMEGAAFFYACEQFGILAMQIRAISNRVEKRNKSNWKIDLALRNLAAEMHNVLKAL